MHLARHSLEFPFHIFPKGLRIVEFYSINLKCVLEQKKGLDGFIQNVQFGEFPQHKGYADVMPLAVPRRAMRMERMKMLGYEI
jgi:hypothetical protein